MCDEEPVQHNTSSTLPAESSETNSVLGNYSKETEDQYKQSWWAKMWGGILHNDRNEKTPEDAWKELHTIKLRNELWFSWILLVTNIFIVAFSLYKVFDIVYLVGNGKLKIHDTVLCTLLGTTAANIITLLLVVTKNIFPNRDSNNEKKSKDN